MILLDNGLVAQSVEQRTENPCVGGSIPSQATISKKQNPLKNREARFFKGFCFFEIRLLGSEGTVTRAVHKSRRRRLLHGESRPKGEAHG